MSHSESDQLLLRCALGDNVELVLFLHVSYLGIYAAISFANMVVSFMTTFFYNLGVLRSSRTIHRKLTDSIFGATLRCVHNTTLMVRFSLRIVDIRWFDTTPTARIIARCTQDIGAIDGAVPLALRQFITQVAAIVTKLGAIVLFSPAFLLPGILVGFAGLAVGNLYLKAQLSVKREMRYIYIKFVIIAHSRLPLDCF